MLFKKPKPKLDPRVRFQHSSFTRKLDRAKGYQRQNRPLQEGAAAFFSRIGLDSLASKLSVAAAVAILAGLVYIPGILFVKTVTVTGLDDSRSAEVRGLVDQYFHRHILPWPQRNLLLLRRKNLAQFILDSDHSLAHVTSIKKKPFHSLVVTVEPKSEQYMVVAADVRYVLYDDGTVVSVLPPEVSAQPQSGLIPMTVGAVTSAQPGDRYLSSGFAAVLETLVRNLPTQAGQTLASISLPGPAIDLTMPAPEQAATSTTATAPAEVTPPPAQPQILPLDPREISIYTPKKQNGKDGAVQFKIVLDTQTNMDDVLPKLGLLLHKLPPDQYLRLAYVDMRLPDRAYVCLVHAPCDK
jgi:hypothetical protein